MTNNNNPFVFYQEDFSQDGEVKQPTISPYMKELQAFLERISKDFLQNFLCKVREYIISEQLYLTQIIQNCKINRWQVIIILLLLYFQGFIDAELRPLAEKIIHQFVLHASLIRPLGTAGMVHSFTLNYLLFLVDIIKQEWKQSI